MKTIFFSLVTIFSFYWLCALVYVVYRSRIEPFKNLPWKRATTFKLYFSVRYSNNIPYFGHIKVLFWEKRFGESNPKKQTTNTLRATPKEMYDISRTLREQLINVRIEQIKAIDPKLAEKLYQRTLEELEGEFMYANYLMKKEESEWFLQKQIEYLNKVFNDGK